MSGVIIIVCLLLVLALFVALRYEGYAKRSKERGELEEPLLTGIARGVRTDLRKLWKR